MIAYGRRTRAPKDIGVARKARRRVLGLCLTTVLLGVSAWTLTATAASAANGSNLRTIIADRAGAACSSTDAQGDHGGVGTGLAFDGTNLLLSCWDDGNIVAVSPVNGSHVATHAITGRTNFEALAWDNGRKLLWACTDQANVGTINLVANTFTPKFSTDGCTDGLAYDSSDDSIWASADAAGTVYHSIAGAVIASYPVNLGGSGNSGIAVGGPKLYLANDGGEQIYTVDKAFSSSPALFAEFPRRLEDLECDNVTFAAQGKGAIWSNDAYDNILNAWEIPAGSCTFGGGGGGGGLKGNIFETTLKRCHTVHIGYNRFNDGTVVRWNVTVNGRGIVASGQFTAIGGGKLGSKTYHFVNFPLGYTLPSEASGIQSHIHIHWATGNYAATRDPGC